MERWRRQQAQRGYPEHPQSYQQQAPHEYHQAQAGQQDYPQAQHGDSQAHYGDPHHAVPSDPFQPPFAEPGHAQRQGAHFAPQFERFAPVPPPSSYEPPQGFDPHALQGGAGGHEQVLDPFHAQRAARPRFEPHGFGSAPQGQPQDPFQTHDPYRQQEAYPAPHDAHAEPQSWDLSHYQPGQIPQGYHGQPAPQPQMQPEWGAPQPGAHDAQWQHGHEAQGHWGGPGELQAGGHPMPFDPALAAQYPNEYPNQPFDPGFGHDPAHGHGIHDHGMAGEAEAYDPPVEPRRGPGTLMIAGMVVGAIVVGGGLAMAYKHLVGGSSTATVAEIRRQTSPEKVRPDDPGGRTIEHSNSQFLNRAAGDGAESRQSDIDGSSKKVATIPIVVNRDGSYTPQASTAPDSGSGVPGLILDGFGPPPGSAPPPPALRGSHTDAPPQASRLPPPPPPVERVPPARVADLPTPKIMNDAPAAAAAVERPQPPARKTVTAARDDLMATAATASGLGNPPSKPAASVGGRGYVAVLASKKSREEALKAFADLHAQYPEVLGRVTPDVREANLGERGVWYRLIGGPPGSRESARDLCAKLKTRGMKDCWPVAY
jgi:hypothetical protein